MFRGPQIKIDTNSSTPIIKRLIFPFRSCFMNGISANKITAANI